MTPDTGTETHGDLQHQVRHIIQDRDRGAAAIGRDLRRLCVPFTGDQAEGEALARLIVEEKPVMAPVLHVANHLLGGPEPPPPAEGLGASGLGGITQTSRKDSPVDPSVREAVDRIRRLVPDRPSRVMTYSASGTVEAVLDILQEEASLEAVYLSEAQPGGEGRALAARLAAEWGPRDTRVVLTHDAALPALLSRVDCLIMGADLVLPQGIVNKVGTAPLVERAHREGIPVVIAGSLDKAPPKGVHQTHLPLPLATQAGELPDPPTGVETVGLAFEWVDLRGLSLPRWARDPDVPVAQEGLIRVLTELVEEHERKTRAL